MKLHLGAGRVIFPAERDNAPVHLLPLPDSAYEAGWVNVDRVAAPGIQERVDLFKFPWVRSSNGSPWSDSSVDEIYCAHLVEHIPHQVAVAPNLPSPLAVLYRERVDRHDGWFMFFGECWRILKPGGRVHVVAPWGMSVGGLTDPTHTRAIMLGSFEYLKRPEATATFDYEVPCNFELEPPLLKLTEEWLPKLADIEPADLTRIANTYFNVASELRIGLRAIKD